MKYDIELLKERLLYYRRTIHANPEKGWMEYATAAFISKELVNLDYKVKRACEIMNMSSAMGLPEREEDEQAFTDALKLYSREELEPFRGNKTAVAGIIDLGKDRTVALRFDMDALPIHESRSERHIPNIDSFGSCNEGVMHSCGHDMHTAVGLGLAHLLMMNRSSLGVNIVLIFQPAEEGVRGSASIVESGFLDNVDCILAAHVWSNMPIGKIVCSQDGTSSTAKYDVIFKGKSAHAGICPEKGNNALLAAANAVVSLHSLVDKYDDRMRLNVGKIEGGSARNIIADNSKIELEFRAKSIDEISSLRDKLIACVARAAMEQACSYELVKQGGALGEKGSVQLSLRLMKFAKESKFFSDVVLRDEENRGCEDFTTMMSRVKSHGGEACFIGVGASLGERELSHHSPDFDISESVMLPLVELLFSFLLKQ